MPVPPAQTTIRTSRAAPYQRLIEKGLITSERIREAASQTYRERGDLETVLITSFGVPAPELGAALSEFYKAPFETFDAKLRIDRALADPACSTSPRAACAAPTRATRGAWASTSCSWPPRASSS